MSDYHWETTFLELFDRCLTRYKGGDEDFENYYSEEDLAFLDSIGYKKREFFDFVEDYGDGGDPPPARAVMIAAVRRDYLHTVQRGEKSDKVLMPADLPGKNEEYDGIRWLPRIIAKAEGKLHGELDPDIMYSCGGDRAFLTRHDLHAADFLRIVWAAEGDPAKVVSFVKKHQV